MEELEMYLKAYVYVSTQFKRHGVKQGTEKKAVSSSVRGQLNKFRMSMESDDKKESEAEKKAHEALPYGSNKKGTNSYYYFKGEEFTLDINSDDYVDQIDDWEDFVKDVTNIATRLQSIQQYDISELKAAYRDKKNEVYHRFLGDRLSVNLNAEQKRVLDSELSELGFTYYESQLVITIICDEKISLLSHCLQDRSTEDGDYVYHIKSRRVITKDLLSISMLEGFNKESDDYLKLLPSKEATRFKTVLIAVLGSNQEVIGYRRKLEKLKE